MIAYEDMLEIRKEHYNANFIEDPEVKSDIQAKCEALYKECIGILDYVDFEALEFLPEEKREEALEIINAPRYKLI